MTLAKAAALLILKVIIAKDHVLQKLFSEQKFDSFVLEIAFDLPAYS